MYLRAFGLREEAFAATPDRRFLYLSDSHREALASLLHGIQKGCGFMSLIAAPGTGKTTLISEILHRTSDYVRSIWVFQTQCTRLELLRSMLYDSGLPSTSTDVVALHRLFTDMLWRNQQQGRKTVLIIDEAQNLGDDVLESIRLLSNIESAHSKLLQIVLAGQPRLASLLSKEELRQRIGIAAHIAPLDVRHVHQYILTRLAVAGRKSPLFATEAVEAIAAQSGGIPRVINNFCFNLLPLAYASKRTFIDRDLVLEVAKDLTLETIEPMPPVGDSRRPLTTGVHHPGNYEGSRTTKSADLPLQGGVSVASDADSNRSSVVLNAWGEPIPNCHAAATSGVRATPANKSREGPSSNHKITANYSPPLGAATATGQAPRSSIINEQHYQGPKSAQVRGRQPPGPLASSQSVMIACLLGFTAAICIGALRSSQQPSEELSLHPYDSRAQGPNATGKKVRARNKVNNSLKRNALIQPSSAAKRQTTLLPGVVPSTKATGGQGPGLDNIASDVSNLTLEAPLHLNLLSPNALQPQILRVSDLRSHLLYSVSPDYPSSAIVAQLQGAVVLDAIVGKNGLVEDVKVLSGHELLARPAAAAVKQWRFRPYLLGGSPVEVKTTVNLQFSLKPKQH